METTDIGSGWQSDELDWAVRAWLFLLADDSGRRWLSFANSPLPTHISIFNWR